MCIYQSFSADPLHQIEQGIWGRHFWQWLKGVYLSASELRKLDEMYVVWIIICDITNSSIGSNTFHHFQKYTTFQMVCQPSNTLQQMNKVQFFM